MKFIAAATGAATRDRAIIVHSTWDDFISTKPLTVRAVLRRYTGAQIIQSRHKITLPWLNEVIVKFDALSSHLLPFTSHVVALHRPPRASGKGGPQAE